jgi:glycoside/pentoside/hexuronide:cation symporter, GPH family
VATLCLLYVYGKQLSTATACRSGNRAPVDRPAVRTHPACIRTLEQRGSRHAIRPEQAHMTLAADRVPFLTKIAYGVGAMAYGIKDNGFSVFLLLYYNQVVGLPAGLVGSVIAVALIFDAMIDPLIGVLSDRTHTRWGRRHPWLYASAIPIALTWMLLWFPPQGSTATVLGWLLVTAVLARAAIATNEVPSLAMAPELTLDYHERTAVLRYRYLFGWIAGLAMLMLAYGVFLAPPIGAMSGPKAAHGFQIYGVFGAGVMAVAVLVSAIGTHRRTAKPPLKRIEPQPVGTIVREMRATLSNRSFIILMIAGIFGYTTHGLGFAISQYNLNYVWQFSSRQLLVYALALLIGMIVIFFIVTPVARALGKVRAAAMLTLVSALFVCSTYTLRLLGLFPEIGSPVLFPLFLLLNTTGTAAGIGSLIIGASMMSDVVEDSEAKTGRREEGLFFAGALFMQKTATGIGIFVVGLILAAAAFPEKAKAGQVPIAIIDRLTLLFVVATIGLSVITALAFLRFPFGETEHNARLAKLAVASEN